MSSGAAVRAAKLPIVETLRRWGFRRMKYNQYGLLYHDLLHETPVVAEAIKRLPEKMNLERNFRLVRASQLSMTHTILPEEEWVKYEDDVRYLTPLIEEVEKEFAEKEEWKKK